MKQFISVMYSLAEQAGGVTRVALTRTQALSSSNTISKIALLSFDDKLDKTFENLVTQGRISNQLNIVNFYKWLAEETATLRETGVTHKKTTTEHLQVKVKRRTDYINQLNGKVIRYFTNNDILFLEEFYNSDGTLAMAAILQPGAPTLKFNSFDSLHAYWLTQLAKEHTTHFIADAIQAAETVCLIESDHTYKILMMHSNHLMKPYTVGSAVAPKYHGVIRNIPRCDSLVVLTEAQLADLNTQFPSDRYKAIGNPININSAPPLTKDKHLAVVVARLHTIKRIKNIIKAFTKVIERIPSARLEIWGSGEQKEELQLEIEKLKANDSIQLMGFATDVSGIFRRASVSLAMSATEGFGVSFAESLAYGTPLVSINTNYGPREIITHGEDGFIVSSEDEFIEKTCLILENEDLSITMGEKGKESMKRFSAESITQRWLSLFEEIENNPRSSTTPLSAGKKTEFNTFASKFGWIYLPETDDQAIINSYKSAKSLTIIEILHTKKFLGEPTGVDKGRYEVDEMVFDEPKGLYRFRLMKNGNTYKGIVAAESVAFIWD